MDSLQNFSLLIQPWVSHFFLASNQTKTIETYDSDVIHNLFSFPNGGSGELSAMTAASYLMGYFGASALAASQIVSQYTMIVVVLIIGLTQALSLLISEAYGKNDNFLVKEYLKAAVTILVVCSFIISIIFLAFPKALIQFYTSQGKTDTRLEYLSIVFFAISSGLIFIDGIRHLLSGALRGLHDSRTPMRIGIIAMWLVSLPISYSIGIICHGGPIGLRIGFVSGFILAAILLFIRIRNKLYLTKLQENYHEKIWITN